MKIFMIFLFLFFSNLSICMSETAILKPLKLKEKKKVQVDPFFYISVPKCGTHLLGSV